MDGDIEPSVILLHGFGQNGRCWGPLVPALAATHRVDALDLPGHGAAGAVRADLWTTADLVADAIEPHAPAAVLGYSMGGRVALHVALAHPDRVSRLVLISASAGIDDAAEREARRSSDDAVAAQIEQAGVAAFVQEWLSLPMFVGLPPEGRFEDERTTNTATGLAWSLRLAGAGTQEPLWSRLGELTMPVLIVAGGRDAKFTALAERMAALIPSSTLAVVAEAGHTVHLEQPDATAELIATWLRV